MVQSEGLGNERQPGTDVLGRVDVEVTVDDETFGKVDQVTLRVVCLEDESES